MITIVKFEILENLISLTRSRSGLVPSIVRMTTWSQVHRRNEVILDKLSQSGNFLILLLHNLDMLGKLEQKMQIIDNITIKIMHMD